VETVLDRIVLPSNIDLKIEFFTKISKVFKNGIDYNKRKNINLKTPNYLALYIANVRKEHNW
jgi:hypothetical protein